MERRASKPRIVASFNSQDRAGRGHVGWVRDQARYGPPRWSAIASSRNKEWVNKRLTSSEVGAYSNSLEHLSDSEERGGASVGEFVRACRGGVVTSGRERLSEELDMGGFVVGNVGDTLADEGRETSALEVVR